MSVLVDGMSISGSFHGIKCIVSAVVDGMSTPGSYHGIESLVSV